jgi:hypothetical protein
MTKEKIFSFKEAIKKFKNIEAERTEQRETSIGQIDANVELNKISLL